MMTFMHGYMKYTQPLFIQALMGLKNVYDSNEVAIHVLGKSTDGDLKRPFKQPPGMFGGRLFFFPDRSFDYAVLIDTLVELL